MIVWLVLASLIVIGIATMVFCCCCVLYTDDFSVNNLASDYTSVSGAWAVAAGVLTTGNASGVLVLNTALPAGSTSVYVKVKVKCSNTGSAARIIIDYVDSSNYWFVELQPGATNGTIKIFQRSGGTNTVKSNVALGGFQANELWTVIVCFDYVKAAILVNTLDDTGTRGGGVSFSTSFTIAATQVGLGTGTNTGTVTFDDLSVERHWDDNTGCNKCYTPCVQCVPTIVPPTQVQIDINSVFDAVGVLHCSDCNGFNATFILDLQVNCTWTYTNNYIACASGSAHYNKLTFSVPSSTDLSLVASGIGGIANIVWDSSGAGADSCNWSSAGLGYDNALSSTAYCNAAFSNAAVTAIP